MFDEIIQDASFLWNVPESWIRAVIETESNWNPNVTGSAGERGLMQISPGTAALYGWDFSTMYDPTANIDAGTHLLHDLRQTLDNDFASVYSAYNSGNPDAWKTDPQVAANTQRALDNLSMYETQSPVTASFGGIALLLLAALLFLRR